MRLRLPRLPAPQYASQSQSSIPSLLTSWPCGCCIFLRVAQVHQFMEIKRKDVWGLLFVLLLGQLVAFSMAISSFTSSLIANLVVKAYQYSYITSITLLDCWTVVWVIILTWYALGTRYSFWQFVGAGTCVAGLALVLLSDAETTDEQDPGKIPLLGDALVIAGTVCYAFSNVGEVSYVLYIGLFAGYAMAFSVFYTVTPYVLKSGGSTLFNLSLLTSDMWAVAIRVLFYRQQINWLYYVAFGVVAIGLIIYSMK
nr:unnamed protein product [Digitaria exilis]